ncbi:MAG: hypothetical protein KatS3mg012_1625 [Gaiellaceae bacterium]|nr:MAG: hypothetical protein KatS3mg012_1625 [Gaiellaceae bacterium]
MGAVFGIEQWTQERREHRLLLAAGVAERLAQDVHRAAPPGTAEHLRDRLLQPRVRVGHDQLDALKAALDERAQEAPPEGLGLALAHIQTDHLPVARLVHCVGEHEALADDPESEA